MVCVFPPLTTLAATVRDPFLTVAWPAKPLVRLSPLRDATVRTELSRTPPLEPGNGVVKLCRASLFSFSVSVVCSDSGFLLIPIPALLVGMARVLTAPKVLIVGLSALFAATVPILPTGLESALLLGTGFAEAAAAMYLEATTRPFFFLPSPLEEMVEIVDSAIEAAGDTASGLGDIPVRNSKLFVGAIYRGDPIGVEDRDPPRDLLYVDPFLDGVFTLSTGDDSVDARLFVESGGLGSREEAFCVGVVEVERRNLEMTGDIFRECVLVDNGELSESDAGGELRRELFADERDASLEKLS